MNSILKFENPADALVGLSTEDGWLFVERLARPGEPNAEDLTGSFFSVGYIAEKGKKKAFVKVIDIHGVLTDKTSNLSLVDRMKRVGESHSFEQQVLNACKRAKLDRIVEKIGEGELVVPGSPLGIDIPYIIFELAEGDVRKVLGRSSAIDDAWKLRILHDVAVGIQQLHQNEIAHQDLKPSNVLVFGKSKERAKIGDLGRSSHRGLDARHDSFDVPGALRYAPPEQVYGIRPERWEDRREGCDLYHLGSLVMFLFAGVTPAGHYVTALGPELRPVRWGGTGACAYETALPMLKAAHADLVRTVEADLPAWAAEELGQIVLTACDPDFRSRGDPTARRRVGNTVGIETYVSRFDRLAKRASVKTRS